MTTKVMASTSGIDSATTSPARMPRLMKLTASTITTASNSALREAADRLLDDDGLVGDEMHADADRQVADDLVHLLLAAPRRTPAGWRPASCRWRGRWPAGR